MHIHTKIICSLRHTTTFPLFVGILIVLGFTRLETYFAVQLCTYIFIRLDELTNAFSCLASLAGAEGLREAQSGKSFFSLLVPECPKGSEVCLGTTVKLQPLEAAMQVQRSSEWFALSNCSSESRGSKFTEQERHYMVLDVCSHDISLGMTQIT